MSVVRSLPWTVLAALALAILCGVPTPFGGALGPPAATGAVSPAGACAGEALLTHYDGRLVAEGGPLPARNLSDVPITIGYTYQESLLNRTTGHVISQSCDSKASAVVTNSSGAFPVNLAIPGSWCSVESEVCVEYSGPFGPLGAAPDAGPPDGYGTNLSISGSALTVRWVADLGGVALSPAGPVAVYSPSAWETVVARPLEGNGTASGVAATYNWTIAGDGWRFVQTPSGPVVNLTASPGAGLGEVWVGAEWASANTTFVVGPANLTLEAVPTSVVAVSGNRSSVDAGDNVSFSVTASGAQGYRYSASLGPGLGLPDRALSCGATPAAGSEEVLTCAGSVTYPDAGVASPEVEVTNGYSTASSPLPNITIRPDPVLTVGPRAPYAYAGVAAEVTLSATSGTGPYALACLASGAGATVCRSGPGPNWTFSPQYAAPGSYAALAWALDAAGRNFTVAFGVVVAPPLSLGSFPANLSGAVAAEPVYLTSELGGGFGPWRYWWNVSGAPTPIGTGVAAADGDLAATWIPPSPGPTDLELTVADAHGTTVSRSLLVSVGNDPARRVEVAVLPPTVPAMAGAPVGIGWEAFAGNGMSVPTYGAAAQVRLAGPDGGAPTAAWVNVSGFGPLSSVGPGAFGVPSTAWALGRLNLTVATTEAGSLTVSLVGLAGVAAPPGVVVEVGPDLAALRLYDPVVALAGNRTNQTYWHVQDRFGNPAGGAEVVVTFSSETVSVDDVRTVASTPDHRSGVWVNFSAPTSGGGSLEVSTPLSGVLLGPLVVPSAPGLSGSGGPSVPVLVGSASALGVAALAVGLLFRRRRRPDPPDAGASEAELREFVEGRDRVIEIVREAGVADLARIDRGFPGGPPPAQLSDWVASLVADGTLGARTGPDGVARFCLVAAPEGPARVVLDAAALARAEAARAALLEDGGADDGTSP